jgi:hypothetical protein
MVPTAWLCWYGTEKEAVLYHGTKVTVATVVLFPNAALTTRSRTITSPLCYATKDPKGYR